MQSEKIEKLFVEFILNVIGPTEKRENDRNVEYLRVKQIIEETISSKFTEYIPHIFLYGSFPIKTYLKEADIDITIIIENKNTHEIIVDIPQDVVNNILILIKDSFENYNQSVNKTLFTDINIIYADIKLIKCQVHSISLDISINNYFGLFKILFMNNIFCQLNKQINNNNENKLIIIKKTILLIKGWCFYEGNLMGSNIGLMASYALEVLIIYMINLYHKDINNEIDGFFYFFNLMKSIDMERSIISIFGLISIENFHKYLFNLETKKIDILDKPFWYINCENENDNKKEKDFLFDINDLKEIITKINKSSINSYFKINKDEQIFKKKFQEKLVNIIDPINSMNNLGKSINFHSFSKMQNAFEHMVKKIIKIKEIKKIGDPFLYIDSLLKLFSITLNMNFIELFINYLNMPKIIVDSHVNEGVINNNNFNILRVNKEDIKQFNKLFIIKKEESHPNINDIQEKNTKFNAKIENKEDEEDEEEEEEEEEESDEEEYEEKEDGEDDGENKKINGNYNGNKNENKNFFQSQINENNKKKTKNKNFDNYVKYENFDIIINNEIMSKLFEIVNNENNNSKDIFYSKLNKITYEHFSELNKFMEDYKLIFINS